MPLGALLWAAPSRGQHITGARRDRVVVSGLRDGEFALCFDRVDDTAILREGLGIERDQKCCDGIIFYAYQQTRVICLVEMKHTNFKEAINQICVVRNSLYSMWQ